MSTLSARAGYDLWAPTYHLETAVSHLENIIVDDMSRITPDARVLDAGCGTGRRMPHPNTVGIDLSFNMIRQSNARSLACASIAALPFANLSFDVVWCRLVLGHIPDLPASYRELARVARHELLLTDFHPDAANAGGTRTFRDADGNVHAIEHYVHSIAEHVKAAESVGFTIRDERAGLVGPEIRSFYETANKLDMYEAQLGSPIVLALRLERA